MWRDFIKNPFKSAVPYIIFHFSNHQIFFAVSQSHVCIVYISIFNEIFYWYTPYNDKFYKLWIITKWTNLCVQKTCEMQTTESALRGEEVKFRDQKMVKEFATNHITRVPGVHFSSVQSLSLVQLFVTWGTAAHQAPCPSPTPRVYPNSCPLSRWCHPTISPSVIPFSHLQSFAASGSSQITW